MHQGDGLQGLFEDLEQQAVGIELAERDAELADRVRGEYATVTLSSRVHASVGRQVSLVMRSGERVAGRLADAGEGWCGLAGDDGATWLVRLGAVATAHGLSDRATPEAVRPAVARLGFGSAVRRHCEGEGPVRLHLVPGDVREGTVGRVGADFAELVPGSGAAPEVVALDAVLAVRVGQSRASSWSASVNG